MSFHSKGAFRPVASRWPLVSHPAQGPKRILLSFGDSQGFRIRSSKAALTSIQHMRGGRRVARSAVAMALLVIAVDHLPWERGGEGEEESNERTLKSRNVYAWPKEVNDVILSLSLARALCSAQIHLSLRLFHLYVYVLCRCRLASFAPFYVTLLSLT